MVYSTRFFFCVALVASLFGWFSAHAEDVPRFQQDRFAVGFWVDPPPGDDMKARYKEIAEANFTLVIGGNTNKPEDIAKQLKYCKRFGLKVLTLRSAFESVDALPDHPACWGYAVRDEPNAADFPALRKEVDAIRHARPGRLAYINLFPDYASAKQLGVATYEEHVARFVEEVDVDVLSMDYYPIFQPNADGRDGYCGNLDVMRRFSQQRGIPFWNFFNTMPFGPHSDPTESQLRWQIYSSLAYGAKGVMYFCYWTPRGAEFPKGGAIITAEGKRTRHYDQAKRINAELKSLGPTLMKLTNRGVLRVEPKADIAATLAESPIESITEGDYLIGVFEHEDGRRAVLIDNYSATYTAWPTIAFRGDATRVVEIDKATGDGVTVCDDSPDMPGLQLSFDAGDGRLFLVR